MTTQYVLSACLQSGKEVLLTESFGYSRLRGEAGGAKRRGEEKREERGVCDPSAHMEGDTKYNIQQEGGEYTT